ncbi:MAG: hypothetical protein P1P64_08475 [Treponemataceae bacterium]
MANEVLLTVTEEERRIAREISENNYQRMLKFESEIAREKGYSKGHAEGYAEGHTQGHTEGISEGYEKDEASGIQKGLNQGLTEGIERGIEKGVYKNKLETAKAFKKMGLPISQIAKGTGLSESEIYEL